MKKLTDEVSTLHLKLKWKTVLETIFYVSFFHFPHFIFSFTTASSSSSFSSLTSHFSFFYFLFQKKNKKYLVVREMDSKKMMMMMVVMVCGLGFGGRWAAAQIHHVVGDDHGWDITTDIASWAEARTFTVGDFLWLAYAGGLDKENVVELRSSDEYESCDLSSPIMMYTDGLDKIHLHEAGIRYFASSNPDNCNKGLKLHVDVMPINSTAQIHSSPSRLAQEPVSPSSSTKIWGPIIMIIFAMGFSHLVAYA